MHQLPSTDEQCAEILEQVVDAYESGRYDWYRGNLINDDLLAPAYCVVGAVNRELGVSNSVLRTCGSTDTFIYQIAAHVFRVENARSLYKVNDQPGQTRENMIDFIKNRAKELRNRSGEKS